MEVCEEEEETKAGCSRIIIPDEIVKEEPIDDYFSSMEGGNIENGTENPLKMEDPTPIKEESGAEVSLKLEEIVPKAEPIEDSYPGCSNTGPTIDEKIDGVVVKDESLGPLSTPSQVIVKRNCKVVQRVVAQRPTFACQECGEKFKFVFQLEAHDKQFHKRYFEMEDAEEQEIKTRKKKCDDPDWPDPKSKLPKSTPKVSSKSGMKEDPEDPEPPRKQVCRPHRPFAPKKRFCEDCNETHRTTEEARECRKQRVKSHTSMEGCLYRSTHKRIWKDADPDYANRNVPQYVKCGLCKKQSLVKEHRLHAIRVHPENVEERKCMAKTCIAMRKRIEEGVASRITKHNTRCYPMYERKNCPICEAEMTSFFNLHNHYLAEHAAEYILQYICNGCFVIFGSPQALRKHIVTNRLKGVDTCRGMADILHPKKRATKDEIVAAYTHPYEVKFFKED